MGWTWMGGARMGGAGRGRVRLGAGIVAVGALAASQVLLTMGRGYGAAAWCAAAQAAAGGALLWAALPRLPWAGPAAAGMLLAGLGIGSAWSAEAGVLAMAGLGHALLYGSLLGVFAASLRPGRTSVATKVARRVNPAFHAGMVPYTRGVTAAWCGLFAGQLAASAALLAAAPGAWRLLVTVLHGPLVLLMAAAEMLVRRWRWRQQRATGLADMVRGVRALVSDATKSGI